MTDEQISNTADAVRNTVDGLLRNPYDFEAGKPLPALMEPHEVEAVASEVERALVKACYLVEFKRLRAKGRLLEPRE